MKFFVQFLISLTLIGGSFMGVVLVSGVEGLFQGANLPFGVFALAIYCYGIFAGYRALLDRGAWHLHCTVLGLFQAVSITTPELVYEQVTGLGVFLYYSSEPDIIFRWSCGAEIRSFLMVKDLDFTQVGVNFWGVFLVLSSITIFFDDRQNKSMELTSKAALYS